MAPMNSWPNSQFPPTRQMFIDLTQDDVDELDELDQAEDEEEVSSLRHASRPNRSLMISDYIVQRYAIYRVRNSTKTALLIRRWSLDCHYRIKV